LIITHVEEIHVDLGKLENQLIRFEAASIPDVVFNHFDTSVTMLNFRLTGTPRRRLCPMQDVSFHMTMAGSITDHSHSNVRKYERVQRSEKVAGIITIFQASFRRPENEFTLDILEFLRHGEVNRWVTEVDH
jgi:hypothetical protein